MPRLYEIILEKEKDCLDIKAPEDIERYWWGWRAIITPRKGTYDKTYFNLQEEGYQGCEIDSLTLSCSVDLEYMAKMISSSGREMTYYFTPLVGKIEIEEKVFYCTKRGKFVNKNSKKKYSKFTQVDYKFKAEVDEEEVNIIIKITKEIKILGKKNKLINSWFA